MERPAAQTDSDGPEPPLVIPPDPAVPRAPVLQRVMSITSQVYRIRWTVDARKLKSTDREAVSPSFDLSLGVPLQFKMVVRPKVVNEGRGGASFKKAKGKGAVELRCLAEVDPGANPNVNFRIAVGNGSGTSLEPARGPVRHNFTERAICGLPEGQDEWDFGQHVDQETQTFMVCLEILSGPGAQGTA